MCERKRERERDMTKMNERDFYLLDILGCA